MDGVGEWRDGLFVWGDLGVAMEEEGSVVLGFLNADLSPPTINSSNFETTIGHYSVEAREITDSKSKSVTNTVFPKAELNPS